MNSRPALPLAALLLVAVASYGAGNRGPGPGKAASKYVTVRGEVLDLGCYTAHGLHGALHRQCATQCLNSGVPMGLMTADSVLYTLTPYHDRAMAPMNYPPPDPYVLCRSWASLQVEVSGLTWERNGMKYLEVMQSKPAPPEEPK